MLNDPKSMRETQIEFTQEVARMFHAAGIPYRRIRSKREPSRAIPTYDQFVRTKLDWIKYKYMGGDNI